MEAESGKPEGASKPRSIAETRQDARRENDDSPQHPPLRAALLMVAVVAVIVLLSAVDLVR
ncbi:MAG: hypothetical protein KAZ88_11915 [Acidimicrobiia bacterium]|nr:hypothetical protein [Acidimicrobiia bacterium]MBP8181684.1 hypothetical protein [Acidimicrobiia bacterium]